MVVHFENLNNQECRALQELCGDLRWEIQSPRSHAITAHRKQTIILAYRYLKRSKGNLRISI